MMNKKSLEEHDDFETGNQAGGANGIGRGVLYSAVHCASKRHSPPSEQTGFLGALPGAVAH